MPIPMKFQRVVDILFKEWLFILSAAGLILFSAYIGRLPHWTLNELQVLYFLFLLFVMVKGLENSGLLRQLALAMERGRNVAAKLVILTFLLSMLVTNDVALIVIVPLTLLLNYQRMDLLVILEALAANVGSALTPFGNPQNLFIYLHYRVHILEFMWTISLLAISGFVLLVAAAFYLHSGALPARQRQAVMPGRRAYAYLAGFLIVILSLLHLLPVWLASLTLIVVVLFDRRSFVIDYALLLSFICLFGLAGELDIFLHRSINEAVSVFWYTVLGSQLISNVPATILLAHMTENWQALLWGASVGGFGSLIGSFANVIAYRQYVHTISVRAIPGFTLRFVTIGYLAFAIGGGLFLSWHMT